MFQGGTVVGSVRFSWRGGWWARADRGASKPRSAAAVLSLLVLAACAVGPDFVAPPAPPGAGYTPEGHLAATASADVAGGTAQKFDIGRDIPGEWWTVFHSKELDSLIAEALQANPSLQAAQAALWQAKENFYVQRGKLLPVADANSSAERQQFSPAAFGGTGNPSIFNLYQASINVSYAPDVFGGQRRQIESTQAQAEYQRFELEATYLTLTSNVVTAAVQEASLRGQIEATLDIIKAETDQLGVVRNQFDVGAATRADVLTQQSEVATAQATLPPLQKQLEQQHHVLLSLDRPFSKRWTARSSQPGGVAAADASSRKPAVATCRAAAGRARRRSAIASGQRPGRRRHCQPPAAVQSHRRLRHRRADDGKYVRSEHDCMEHRGQRHAAYFPRLPAIAPATRRRGRITTQCRRSTGTQSSRHSRMSPTRCARCNSTPPRFAPSARR